MYLFIKATLFVFLFGSFASADPHYSFEFSPSPRSNDYHEMFDSEYASKWSALPNRLTWFNFHQMAYLRKVAKPTGALHSDLLNVSNNAYLSGGEAISAATMMRAHNLRPSVTISNGLSYGKPCKEFVNAAEAGQEAAQFEFNQLETLRIALASKGKEIERIYVDGPFLRVLKYTKKAYSCGTFDHNGLGPVLLGTGRRPAGDSGAVKVVHEYLKELKALFPRAQLFITLNIVNWKQDNIPPHYGTHAYKFEDVFGLYLSNYYKNGVDYKLNGIQFDAPYNVVNANLDQFRRRVKLVYGQLAGNITHENNMSLVFYVNSEDDYKFDHHMVNKGFYYFRESKADKYSEAISKTTVCGSSTNNTKCLNNDSVYYQDSSDYADSLKAMISGDVTLRALPSVTFTYGSWHVGPSSSIGGAGSYTDFITSEIPRVLSE